MTEHIKLTAKREKFAQCIADGMTQSDAYRAAYNADNMKATSINVNASKLCADTNIKQRVAQLKGALEEKALWSREKSVKALANIADSGEAKPTEIVAAIKELNAMHGFNAPTKTELAVTFPRVINVIAGRA